MAMRVVFVLFDTLIRGALSPYGADASLTPNFSRLARRCATYDQHHVGSLPCMPARRDLHTGRLSFMHRSWGPLEPFDDSFPECLAAGGIYSHLVSDHYHYWEDGGATYHNRYASYEFIRGQEADPWKAMVEPPWERLRSLYHRLQYSEDLRSKYRIHMINREFIRADEDFPSWQCFSAGLDFLERNRDADHWLLQIETFDPHEPFFAPARLRERFPTGYRGPILDWPPYARVTQAPEECAELRANYLALLAFCDEQMGRLLDHFDRHDLWQDTALVVTTDHGFLLGEHDWWAKVRMPVYQEVAHIPLFIHSPAHPRAAGTRRQMLTQTPDLMPTLLDLFGVPVPEDVRGRSLLPTLDSPQARLHEAVLFGHWGAAVNLTDGRYTYFRYPREVGAGDIFQYTLMPTHMTTRFGVEELSAATLSPPLPFTKNVPLLRVPGTDKSPTRWLAPGFYADCDTVVYDTQSDPRQLRPLQDPALEARLAAQMVGLMRLHDAPPELYLRLGLAQD
jgi:arylsulfatase A-like enzyme